MVIVLHLTAPFTQREASDRRLDPTWDAPKEMPAVPESGLRILYCGALLVGQVVSCVGMLWTRNATSKEGKAHNVQLTLLFAILALFRGALVQAMLTTTTAMLITAAECPGTRPARTRMGTLASNTPTLTTRPGTIMEGMVRQLTGDGTGGTGCRALCDADAACDGFTVRSDEQCHTYTKPLTFSWVDDGDAVTYAACASLFKSALKFAPLPPKFAPLLPPKSAPPKTTTSPLAEKPPLFTSQLGIGSGGQRQLQSATDTTCSGDGGNGPEACANCTGLTAPAGGTLGTCYADGTMPNSHRRDCH